MMCSAIMRPHSTVLAISIGSLGTNIIMHLIIYMYVHEVICMFVDAYLYWCM